jgi:hypothetical protein
MAGEVNASVRSMRRAAVVAGAGLLVQLAASFYWTPLTFIGSAMVGLPLVGIGALLFLRAVFRIMKERGVL